MKLLRNIKTVVTHPNFAFEYVDYCGSKLRHGNARKTLPGGVTVSSFSGFSEFHSVRDFVNPMERAFFTTFPFGRGDVFDVGANLGVISLMLAKNQSSERIFAFEPNSFTFTALVDNIRLNGAQVVKPQRLAVSDVDGSIPFAADPVRRGTASIARGARAADSVASVTLDRFINNHGIERIGVIKVDVEGYETAVFLGAHKVLEQKLASVIYYEVCPEITRRAGFEPLGPTRMLQGHGYEIFALKQEKRLESINPTVEIKSVACENWIGLLPDRISAASSWIA